MSTSAKPVAERWSPFLLNKTDELFGSKILLLTDWNLCTLEIKHASSVFMVIGQMQPSALTWYMTEDGSGSMHGCWSGSGSSSSRSTLERASSKVTVDVMLLRRPREEYLQLLSRKAILYTDRKREFALWFGHISDLKMKWSNWFSIRFGGTM